MRFYKKLKVFPLLIPDSLNLVSVDNFMAGSFAKLSFKLECYIKDRHALLYTTQLFIASSDVVKLLSTPQAKSQRASFESAVLS